MNRDRFETLVGRYLDQAIDEEEAKELLEAISRQPDLCEEMLRDVGTAQALERWGRPDQEGLAERVMARLRDAADGEHMVEDVMRRLPRGSRPGALPAASGRRPPKRYVVGAAVAACLLLAVTFALLSRRTPAAQLLETDEGVVVRRGDREIAGTVDLGLRWEDKLDVPDGRLAVIEFTDQTRIECEGAASLSLRRDDKKRWVEVSSGRLDVHVRPQAERQPMTVATAHGEINVTGTRFSVVVSAFGTAVRVRSGHVRFVHRRNKVDVDAGEAVVATSVGIQSLGQLSRDEFDLLPGRIVFEENFSDTGPVRWSGSARAVRDGDRSSVRLQEMPGQEYISIWVRREDAAPLFQVRPGQVFHVTWRTKNRRYVKFALLMRCGGNDARWTARPPRRADGDWETISVPVEQFVYRGNEEVPPFDVLDGACWGVKVFTSRDVEMEIDRIWITEPSASAPPSQ